MPSRLRPTSPSSCICILRCLPAVCSLVCSSSSTWDGAKEEHYDHRRTHTTRHSDEYLTAGLWPRPARDAGGCDLSIPPARLVGASATGHGCCRAIGCSSLGGGV